MKPGETIIAHEEEGNLWTGTGTRTLHRHWCVRSPVDQPNPRLQLVHSILYQTTGVDVLTNGVSAATAESKIQRNITERSTRGFPDTLVR